MGVGGIEEEVGSGGQGGSLEVTPEDGKLESREDVDRAGMMGEGTVPLEAAVAPR